MEYTQQQYLADCAHKKWAAWDPESRRKDPQGLKGIAQDNSISTSYEHKAKLINCNLCFSLKNSASQF